VRLGLIALFVAAIWWGIAPTATADVDPASDLLLLENVFFPYQPRVCTQLKDGLTRLTADAKRANYPVKVALIESTTDLGGAPEFFGRPQDYARFLFGEIGRQANAPVLIAMPGGLAMAPKGPEASVLDKLSIPDDADSNRLARAAIDAIPRLAAEAGRTVAKPKIGSGCSTNSSSSALIFIVPVALLLLAGAALALGRRGPRPSQA
jgi:hypothetical protein